jgi:hypothetical protein
MTYSMAPCERVGGKASAALACIPQAGMEPVRCRKKNEKLLLMSNEWCKLLRTQRTRCAAIPVGDVHSRDVTVATLTL